VCLRFACRNDYPHLTRGNPPGKRYGARSTDVGSRPYDQHRMYETLLFLHVLSAFVLVAAIGLCWAIYVGGGSLVRLGAVVFPVWGAASIAVLVFGVWLAFDVSGYQIWDGWILAALALWALSGAFGSQLAQGYKKMTDGIPERPALSVHVVATAAVLLLLIDMVWKPGA
jgi:hypothetical protein